MAVTAPDRTAGAPAVVEPGTPALPSGSTAADPTRPAAQPRGTTVLGMLLVLAAEGMMLGVVIAVYFAIKAGSPLWPPSGVNINTYVPTVVSITATMSACSVGWLLVSTKRNDQRSALSASILSVVLGLAMANGQWYSLTQAGFSIGDHAYGTLFYLLMGLHLLHLIAGIVMLVVVGGQTLAGHFGSDDHEPVRATVYFWQFGNVIWSFIVLTLFLISPHAQ
jgi:heme/copper-type cytochrome/quinol oxidase subunit 3